MEASSTANRENKDANMASGKRRDGGSYSLVRHNSAVFEHDFNTNRSSLVRTVSEVREEMQVGGRHRRKDHEDDYGGDNKPRKGASDRKLVREVSHEVSHESYSSPTTATKGQIDSFVYKNYSLQDRRTVSLPIGKKYSLNRSTKVKSRSDTKSSRNASYTQSQTSIIETSSSDSSIRSILDDKTLHDIDREVDIHSRLALIYQVGSFLLTVLTAVLILCLCIRYLTSGTSADNVDARVGCNSSGTLQKGDGKIFSCKPSAKACPLLGLLAAGLVAVGAWLSDGRFWHRTQKETACSQCEDYEDNRNRAEEADGKVQRAQRSKQQFMAYVFHNIRVPFNAIVLGLGHIRATGDGGGSFENYSDKMDLVQMMLDCAETMTSVLDDVTDMGQWEIGQMELHRDEFDILAVIKFLAWGLKDLVEQKNIVFNINVDDLATQILTSNKVIGDKQRIVQTLGNFLSNAVKFTPAGGKLDLELQCEEVVDSKEPDVPAVNSAHPAAVGPYEDSLLGAAGIQILTRNSTKKQSEGKVARLRLSVKDNGIGISVEDQAKLFEPYSFVTSGWVQKAGVSGLGLSMAKRFVERAGGSIGVESAEGSGSTFFFSIPFPLVPVDMKDECKQSKVDLGAALLQKSEVTQSKSSSGVTVVHESITLSRRRSNAGLKEEMKMAPEVVAAKSSDATPEKVEGSQRKVLLVEDTKINRIILRKVLLNLNLQCDEAENGQIAVDYLKQGKKYDLILMDKEMPIMDGHEATRQLRTMGVKTPIIALTGNALATDRDLFFEAGVDDFQTKPLSRDKLVQLLAHYGVESTSVKRG